MQREVFIKTLLAHLIADGLDRALGGASAASRRICVVAKEHPVYSPVLEALATTITGAALTVDICLDLFRNEKNRRYSF